MLPGCEGEGGESALGLVVVVLLSVLVLGGAGGQSASGLCCSSLPSCCLFLFWGGGPVSFRAVKDQLKVKSKSGGDSTARILDLCAEAHKGAEGWHNAEPTVCSCTQKLAGEKGDTKKKAC